jgi:hypothetical protein
LIRLIWLDTGRYQHVRTHVRCGLLLYNLNGNRAAINHGPWMAKEKHGVPFK